MYKTHNTLSAYCVNIAVCMKQMSHFIGSAVVVIVW